jgi:hypothetical protein
VVKQNGPLLGARFAVLLRREWDLNPRAPSGTNRFGGGSISPLWHLSTVQFATRRLQMANV